MADRLILQSIAFPDPEVCAETALFYHLAGPARLDSSEQTFVLDPDSVVVFDGYYNLFNIGTWSHFCRLDGLFLRLNGEGVLSLEIVAIDAPNTETVIHSSRVDLSEHGSAEIDLSAWLDARPDGDGGILVFRVTSTERTCALRGGLWSTHNTSDRPAPKLGIAITTFRRDAEVTETIHRLDQFIAQNPAAAEMHCFVVDNGRSLDIPTRSHVTVIPNPNFGGSGGFARGLMAASDAGMSHCLFMDDDASILVESLLRTVAFLWLAKSENTALSGAMIAEARKWQIWESGALFDGQCRPQHHSADLRDREDLIAMEIDAAHDRPDGFFGGWWFFAFPISQVEHWPFPYFVRGDDSAFSLSNNFRHATLNGVASFQEDFSAKESPLVHYLDMRYHIAHLLSIPQLHRGALSSTRFPLAAIVRALVRFHYESAEAMLLAWQDIMDGPDTFIDNLDMSQRRQDLLALQDKEKWHPIDTENLPPPAGQEDAKAAPGRRLWLLLLNGHLLPFHRRHGRHVTIPAQLRSALRPIWGASQITYLDETGARGYTVALDRRRAIAILRQTVAALVKWLRRHGRLKSDYRRAYPDMTSRAFWEGLFEGEGRQQ